MVYIFEFLFTACVPNLSSVRRNCHSS